MQRPCKDVVCMPACIFYTIIKSIEYKIRVTGSKITNLLSTVTQCVSLSYTRHDVLYKWILNTIIKSI